MEKNSPTGPAPSIRAASNSAGWMFATPLKSSTRQSPMPSQLPTSPTAGKAVSKSPSQARVSESSPTRRSNWLTSPFGE
jgi:hypothetical protein